MLTLKDTTEPMLSDDYKERFKAEYMQTYIRTEKLGKMLNNWKNLNFKPACPKYLLIHQYKLMEDLLKVYRERAEREEIKLPAVSEFYI